MVLFQERGFRRGRLESWDERKVQLQILFAEVGNATVLDKSQRSEKSDVKKIFSTKNQ